jgi:hypothetical protein
LDQGREQIATFVRLCRCLVGKHAIIDVVDVLNDGIGTDDAAMDSRSAGKRSREQNSGKASEMHVEVWYLDLEICIRMKTLVQT